MWTGCFGSPVNLLLHTSVAATYLILFLSVSKFSLSLHMLLAVSQSPGLPAECGENILCDFLIYFPWSETSKGVLIMWTKIPF